MAKNNDTAITKMTRKAKILNFLKIFGFSFAGVMVMVASVVVYVWLTGGFNPPYEPLSVWYWATEGRSEDSETDPQEKTEFVIDGNKEIELDEEGHQKKDSDGNLVWKQKTDKEGNPIYESIYIVPNKGCTELDAVLEIAFSSNPSSLVLQLVEDDNVKAIKPESQEEQSEEQAGSQTNNQEEVYYTKYNVKINSPIYLKPLTKKVLVNGKEIETNVGGWVKLTATQGLLTTSCWVFVDTAITDLKLELNQNIELENDGESSQKVYNVYPNSVLSVKSIMSPNGSLVLPSTTNPAGKGATAYTNKKSVYYQTSNAEIASIDNFGNITIMPHKEGETFSVNAYVVANYNNIGHEPSIQDFEGDPSQDAVVPYTRAFDKIRVWSNTLTFKINEISVESLTTGPKSTVIHPYSVFESGTINFSNLETNPRKNNYFVDLLFSNTADESYKNSLLSQVQLYIGFEGEATDAPESIKSVEDIVMNGKQIEDASKYISFEKVNGVYHYTVNEYSESKFYIFLYYEMHEEETILWDYIPISLQKEKVTNVSTKESAISLTYNGTDDFETYSLNGFATITPSNSTYKNILYFVPNTTDLIETDDSITAFIAGKECVAIASRSVFEDSEEIDYFKIKPTGSGKTYFYAAVVRTTQELDQEHFVEYISNLETQQDYLIVNQDGYVEIEYSSEFVNVTISKTVTFNGIESSETTDIDDDDLDYNFARDCDIFARIYKGEDLDIEISYDGTTDALENGRLNVSLLAGADSTICSLTNQDNTTDGSYTFKIVSNKVGNVKYQVTYDGNLLYTIGVVVLTTELSGLNMQADNHDITLDFVAGNDNIATGFEWSDFELNLEYNSPKTNDVNFEIETYAVADEYVSLLDKYAGKDFTENVAGVPEEINTIEKLISKLTATESIIKVYANTIDNADADIIVNANERISFNYKFVGVGRVLLVAHSITTNIYSNPVLVNVVCPEVKIIRGENEELTTKQTKTVVSYGEMTSIDNHTTAAKQINLFGTGAEFIKFVAQVGDKVYDLQNLVFFKFEQQTATEQEYISTKSDAKISLLGTHAVLTLCDISNNISENIIAFTNFGYENDEFYQYNLVPDYKYIMNNFDEEHKEKDYYTPAIVDLFTGTTSACGDIVFTNAEYDFNNQVAVSGNKLYLPNGFANDIEDLKTKLPSEFVDSFNYEDEEGQGEYYHIYFAITVASDGNYNNNYDRDGYLIKLKYKSTGQKIDVRFMSTSGYLLGTKINVKPGVEYKGNTSKNIHSGNLTVGANFNEILDNFEKETNFDVKISSVDFAVSGNISEDLSFYYQNADNKYVETFVEVLPEDIGYKTEIEYSELSPVEQELYTEYFIKTSDVGIVLGKNYYINDAGEYKNVLTPSADEIDDYFEKVYIENTKTYYGRETYYEKIDASLISQEYVSKYYVEIFKKASPTFNETETYYVQNGDIYEIVASPSAENIANYYVKDYMPATSYASNTEYYYKKNFKRLGAGANITEVFELATISLSKVGENFVLSATAEDTAKLQNLSDSIDLSFVITIEIKNTAIEVSDNYKMRYKIVIV